MKSQEPEISHGDPDLLGDGVWADVAVVGPQADIEAVWVIRQHGDSYVIENYINKRFLLMDPVYYTGDGFDGEEGGTDNSPLLYTSDANYYDLALWQVYR